MLSFNFRGKDSYKDFGILIQKKPSIPMPERRVQYETIPGRNGTLAVDDGTYDGITITVECGFVNSNVKQRANEIKAWLMGFLDKLIFSDEDDKYYEAQVVNKFDIAQSIITFGEFPVVFNCKPFKKAVDDDKYIILDSCISRSGSVINPLISYSFTGGTSLGNNVPVRIYSQPIVFGNDGTVESDPIINIYGSGNTSVTLNGSTFSINNVDSYVTVDSELQDAYKDTQLKNNDMIGEFPILQCGDNKISWTGTVNKIEIQCKSNWI